MPSPKIIKSIDSKNLRIIQRNKIVARILDKRFPECTDEIKSLIYALSALFYHETRMGNELDRDCDPKSLIREIISRNGHFDLLEKLDSSLLFSAIVSLSRKVGFTPEMFTIEGEKCIFSWEPIKPRIKELEVIPEIDEILDLEKSVAPLETSLSNLDISNVLDMD